MKILMKIDLPLMRGSLVMMMASISPSRRGFPRQNSSAGAIDWFCSSSASRRRCFVPKVLPLFFLGQNDLYTRRGAPEVGRGGHNPPGCAWAPWRPQVGCAHLVGPLSYLLAPTFLIYHIKIPRKVLAHLELCRIGSLT